MIRWGGTLLPSGGRWNGPPKYNARVFDSCQNAEKMFVKMLIMNNFRKFCKHLDIKSVLYRIVLYQTNKIDRR